jgi:hypothetical protein
MTDPNTSTKVYAWQEDGKKLPDMLNVLSILTFIGCGLGIIFSLLGFFNARSNYDAIVKAQDKMDQAPAFVRRMMGSDPVGMATKLMDNRLPILLLGLVATLLCLYGAIQMRKLNKTGYWVYLLGELLPFVTTYLFIGSMEMGFTLIFGIALVVVFLLLYATQLKYMK